VLRGLPAGRVTLVAKAGGRQTSQVIELAAAPTVVEGVELALR
jgi:hypothetical protein